jgi:DnaJ-domain-containing protein 1
VRLVYRLGRSRATGVLTVSEHRDGKSMEAELLVLRRGFLMTAEDDPLGRVASRRLARIASLQHADVHFDGGTSAYPPGAVRRQFAVAGWARKHLESQIDATRARDMVKELAGVRLVLRDELAPDASLCDKTDQRILDAMRQPRRLDQIWPIARTPRFRLLTFLHFLRSVGALTLLGVAAPVREVTPPRRDQAHRLLGVSAGADRAAVKRAYRRLARALHPDLHPSADDERRRRLERQLCAVTDAYRELNG